MLSLSCAAPRGRSSPLVSTPREAPAPLGLVASSEVELAAWAERAPLEVLVPDDARAAVERARRTSWRDAIRLSVDALGLFSPGHVAHAVHFALVVRADVWSRLFGAQVELPAPTDARLVIEPTSAPTLTQPQLRARRAALVLGAGED